MANVPVVLDDWMGSTGWDRVGVEVCLGFLDASWVSNALKSMLVHQTLGCNQCLVNAPHGICMTARIMESIQKISQQN